MTGLVRKATLLCVAGVLVAGAAMAGVPSPANSQKPCILLMDFGNSNTGIGVNQGVCGQPALKVIVRDANNAPVAGATVVLDFSICNTGGATGSAGNVQLGSVQDDAGVAIACGGKTATKTANGLGEVCFSLHGTTNINVPGGTPSRNWGPNVKFHCCKIYADAQLLGTVDVALNRYDMDNNGVVDSVDGSFHLQAQGEDLAANYRTFGDYNCDGFVDSGDGSLHLQAQGNALAGVTVYTGTYCP